jgi:integrase
MIIILATMTGLRIGEILALRWGRIDLLRGTLRVAETCYKGHFGSPKTRGSRREVPLAAAVVPLFAFDRKLSRGIGIL